MIFISNDKPNKIYAKVWKVEKKENYTAFNISTSDKQKDNTYKNSNWNCRAVGKAKDIDVNANDRIIITQAKIENIYDKEKNKSWLNIIVFDFEVDANTQQQGFTALEQEGVEELPF